jgi:hypothetical protein
MLRYSTHPLVALIITLAVIVFYISLVKTERSIKSSTALLDVLQSEVREKQISLADLEAKLQQATSSANQEKIVRDQLLLQKPGEYIVQIPPLEEKVSPVERVVKKSPRQEWWELLRGTY